jgi:hypothetical protein
MSAQSQAFHLKRLEHEDVHRVCGLAKKAEPRGPGVEVVGVGHLLSQPRLGGADWLHPRRVPVVVMVVPSGTKSNNTS